MPLSKLSQCLWPLIATLILIAIPVILLWPGLSGPFLLDDHSNINALVLIEKMGGGGPGIFHYLASGDAGPLGRPISLLSFLINDNAWPSDPSGFKFTNLMIHVLCGLVTFWLIFRISLAYGLKNSAAMACAWLSTLIWIVHPINISTTLYVVQRMTQLGYLFVVLALLCFVVAQENLKNTKRSAVMLFGFMVFVFLGVLSKENTILVLLAAIVIEKIFFGSDNKTPVWYGRWRICVVYTPLFLLSAYFVVSWEGLLAGYESRDFGLAERLLTQPRVLVDYLSSIFLPYTVKSTLFYDDFTFSTGILQPLETAYSIFLLSGLLLVAFFSAKKSPILAFCIFWFFTFHIIESSFIPLELYFEHRNYLPSLGVCWAIGYLVIRSFQAADSNLIKSSVVATIFFVVFTVGLISHQVAKTWGSEAELYFTWVYQSPESQRAYFQLAHYLDDNGRGGDSIAVLENLIEEHPQELGARVRLAALYCKYQKKVPDDVWEGWEPKNTSVDASSIIGAFVRYIEAEKREFCPQIDAEAVLLLAEKIKSYPSVRDRPRVYAKILYEEALFYAGKMELQVSMQLLDQVASIQKTVDIPLRQASLLINVGLYYPALFYIEKAKEIDMARNWRMPSRRTEIDNLETLVHRYIEARESSKV